MMKTDMFVDYILKNLNFLGLDENINCHKIEEILGYYLEKDISFFTREYNLEDSKIEVDKVNGKDCNKIIAYFIDKAIIIKKCNNSLVIIENETNIPLFIIEFTLNGIKNYILGQEIDVLSLNKENFEYQKYLNENDIFIKVKDVILEPLGIRDNEVEYYNLHLKNDCKDQSILLKIFEGLKNNSLVTIAKDDKIKAILQSFDKSNDLTRKRTLK